MEAFISAAIGELASRSINFLISKSSKPKVLDVEDSLQRALLRAQVIIDEATGRYITNQAMLQQLDMLRDAMHQGRYILDTFRYQSHDVEHAKDQVVSHSLSLSKVNYLKGICFSVRKTLLLEQLQMALENLSSMILDVKELVVFLTSYPRLHCQPYSMHLQMSNCMFGRQMETELVIDFLLHSQPHCSEELEVLPIVGRSKVGKSTLASHVCKNERVRDHFSEIFFLHDNDFANDELTTLRDGLKHPNCLSDTKQDRRLLIVVDLVGDLNENAWNVLRSYCKSPMSSNSKIILISRCDKIMRFGTTHALNLKYLSPETFWYFFKIVTFGSTDPEMHPRFVHVAMEIAKMLGGCLIGANVIACLLRNNFNVHFWCKVLSFLKGLIQKHVSKFSVGPFFLTNHNKCVHLERIATPFEDLYFYEYESLLQEEFPKIRFQDVMCGSVNALGKLEVLGWTSPIPPYYSYLITCEVQELKSRAAKRKRYLN
jgi:hypothetical protein